MTPSMAVTLAPPLDAPGDEVCDHVGEDAPGEPSEHRAEGDVYRFHRGSSSSIPSIVSIHASSGSLSFTTFILPLRWHSPIYSMRSDMSSMSSQQSVMVGPLG